MEYQAHPWAAGGNANHIYEEKFSNRHEKHLKVYVCFDSEIPFMEVHPSEIITNMLCSGTVLMGEGRGEGQYKRAKREAG